MAGGLIHKINLTRQRTELFKNLIEKVWKDFGITAGLPSNHILKNPNQAEAYSIAKELAEILPKVFNNNELAKLKGFGTNTLKALTIDGLPHEKFVKRKGSLFTGHNDDSKLKIEDWIAESLFLGIGHATGRLRTLVGRTSKQFSVPPHKDYADKLLLFCKKGAQGAYTGVSLSNDTNGQATNLHAGKALLFNDKEVWHYVLDLKKGERQNPTSRLLFTYSTKEISPESELHKITSMYR